MDTTPSSFTARNNAKRAAEKMIANGKVPAVDYGIRPRDDGRFEIVWKTVPTTGEVETEIATAATAAEEGQYSINPRLSVNEDSRDAPPSAGAEEVAAATGNEPAASSVPASGAREPDNKWPDGTRVMVRNKPKSWSEATIYTRLDAEYWRVQYPSGGTRMFKGGDIRVYDAERDAKRTGQPRRARATEPRTASRSRYALDPAVIAAGKLPDRAPVVTWAATRITRPLTSCTSLPPPAIGLLCGVQGQRQQQLFETGRALPAGFAGRARRFEGPPVSNHEARADAGSILRHRPLTYRIVKEI